VFVRLGTESEAGLVEGQLLPGFAHPSCYPGGIAYNQRIIRDILCHDGARADKGEAADGVAGRITILIACEMAVPEAGAATLARTDRFPK